MQKFSLVGMSLENFCGISKANIDFLDNGQARTKITILGDTGTGKTTLMRAMRWVAYGETPGMDVLPIHWNGKIKDSQHAAIKLRLDSPNMTSEDDITFIRKRAKGQIRSTIQVETSEGTFTKKDADHWFRDAFGTTSSGKIGVMWLIQNNEMKMVAEAIAHDQGESLFLDYVNQDTVIKRLEAVQKMYEVQAETEKKDGSDIRSKKLLKDRRKENARKIRERKDKLAEKMLTDAKESSTPTEREVDLAEHAGALEEAQKKHRETHSDFSLSQFDGDSVLNLIKSSMARLLEARHITIPEDSDSDEFEWSEIANFLEKKPEFSEQEVEKIRSLGEDGIGVSVKGIISGQSMAATISHDLKVLRDANSEHNISIGGLEHYNTEGLSQEAIIEAKKSVASAREFRLLKKEDKRRLGELKGQLTEALDEYNTARKDYDKAIRGNRHKAASTKRADLAESMLEVLRKADDEYKTTMLDRTREEIVDLFKLIDIQDRYEPIITRREIHGGKPRLALQRKVDQEIIDVSLEEGQRQAAGGESELLMICACLALAKSTGSKMPIVLDDCFLRIDPGIRTKLVKVVGEQFQNMIFVTNDNAKAELMEPYSDGRLKLEVWPKDTIGIDDESFDWWNWSDEE